VGIVAGGYSVTSANLGEFQKKPVFRWEVKEPNYTYKSTLERGENPFAATESGKIEFYSKEVAAGSGSGKKAKLKEEKPGKANERYGAAIFRRWQKW